MCGIFCCYNRQKDDLSTFRPRCVAMSKRLRHRGPDWSGTYVGKDTIMCHERLAIVGVDTGAQPLISPDGKTILAVNGEIYNHIALRKGLKDKGAVFKTHSDCEVILHLYKEHDTGLCNMLDGMFSFVLLDTTTTPSRLIAARDPIGITTLYQGYKSTEPDTMYFASELKAIHDECDVVMTFPPGHFWDSNLKKHVRYFNPTWWNGDSGKPEDIPHGKVDYDLIRNTLIEAVRKRLMSEVPFGVLLSGGLDSSLVAAIAAREVEKAAAEVQRRREEARKMWLEGGPGGQTPKITNGEVDADTALFSWPQLHSFAIGLEGAPDLVAARKAAKYLGTNHHEFHFTVEDSIDAIPDVVYHIESYDVTTIRASTPMFLLSRRIKSMGVKMVLSGEGSDEELAGYLYFSMAPSPEELHQETVMRVKALHTSDCQRANKSTMSFGVEARVPFLDKKFLEVVMNIDPKEKMFSKESKQQLDEDGRPRIEKYVVRKAFDCEEDGRPWLPESILWRQKEQFSDGVGYAHIDALRAHAEELISDEQMAAAAERFPFNTPDTKEAYWYRDLYEKFFPSKSAAETVVKWVPKQSWGCSSDPSGRAQKYHDAAYENEEAAEQK